MAELLGKVNQEFKSILIKESTIIADLDIASIEAIDFTPSHTLEEDEWFKLPHFSESRFFIDECRTTHSNASLSRLGNNEYKKIGALAIIQDGQTHFQRITPSLFVARKTFLDCSGAPQIVEHRKQIEIKSVSDAVYIPSTDILYFRSIAKIKFIFPGIEELYRKATQDEVDAFVANDFIQLDGIDANKIGDMNRKRIADIGMRYSGLPNNKKKALISYARGKAGVELNNEKFIIKTETDLKKVMYAMDQRYYFADIYDENRIAGSIRVISN